jgi:hypothetical protein
MKILICPTCKRPFLESKKVCSHCPQRDWNQESWLNLGCLLATIVPLFILIFFWIMFFTGIFFR